MKFLHTMIRATHLDDTLDFFCNKLGLVEVNRYDSEAGRFTLVFLAAPGDEDAFEALAAVMAGIVDLDALLEGCASTSGAPAVAFVHGAGGTCDGIAKRVPGPRAEVEVAVRGAAGK